MINSVKVDPDTHAEAVRRSRRQGQKVVGGDFNHGVMKATKNFKTQRAISCHIFYELTVMLIPLMHPCLMRGSRVLLG